MRSTLETTLIRALKRNKNAAVHVFNSGSDWAIERKVEIANRLFEKQGA